jgi:hypothetical protein
MSLPSRRFSEGLTYEQFKARMKENRDQIEAVEREVSLDPADLAAFETLPEALKVLVIGEDWCRDTIDNLPILSRLAQASGKLEVRIFTRDDNQDLMNLYLKDGKYQSLPVFVFFDGAFRELGRFIERPDSVTALRAQRRSELLAARPGIEKDELNDIIRLETRPMANQEVVRELRAIVAKAGV